MIKQWGLPGATCMPGIMQKNPGTFSSDIPMEAIFNLFYEGWFLLLLRFWKTAWPVCTYRLTCKVNMVLLTVKLFIKAVVTFWIWYLSHMAVQLKKNIRTRKCMTMLLLLLYKINTYINPMVSSAMPSSLAVRIRPVVSSCSLLLQSGAQNTPGRQRKDCKKCT